MKDDVVVSNNSNREFWKDDAIEIIVDANNDRVNVNTDEADHPLNDYGGHNYVNYEGRFSRWDDDLQEKSSGWANAVDWEWGPNEGVYGVGSAKPGGWSMEVRFDKSQFEDPNGGGPIAVGDKIGFNIGMDDDDGSDLEIQYWWANRLRPLEFTPDEYSAGATIEDFPPDTWIIDATGRLTHGGTGELIFGGPAVVPTPGDYNSDGKLDVVDLDRQAQAIKDKGPLAPYDENKDGLVNDADRKIWVKNLKKTWIGDADLNFEFNSTDLINVFVAGKYETGQTASWSEGDFNGDMAFGSSDLVDAFVDGGYELGPPPPAAVSTVPEPGSLVLLAIGGLFALRRRRS